MWKVKKKNIKERGRKDVQKGQNIERVHIGAELRHVREKSDPLEL